MGRISSAYGPLAEALSRGTREKTHKYTLWKTPENRIRKRIEEAPEDEDKADDKSGGEQGSQWAQKKARNKK